MSAETVVRQSLEESQAALQALLVNAASLKAIADAGAKLVSTFKNGGRVFSCGNGGSMCDAMHFAEELSGRYRLDRPGLPAVAINDAGHLTCVANDYGYEFVFSRYLEAHAKKGDCLVALSTSGKSKNIMTAVDVAKKLGMTVIGLMGVPDSPLGQAADIRISAPGGKFADRVQELHIKAIHIMIELVERDLFPQNYK
ncbi:MAG TPA: SIS domain-containing protein [Alphaproteobacteria bacterium]|nr:SIS domain-containing protein [Alphaproteobacteria bacterium]